MKTIYTAEQLKSVYGEPQVQQPTPEPQKEGILKSIVKDVAGTLVVNPVTRVTEAVTRTAFPESQAAKGFEMLQEEGQGQNVLGVNVPSVTDGKQIAGEALKTASYLFPYGKVAGVAGKAVGKIGGNVVSGATGGYLADVGYGLTEGETTGEALTPGAGTAIGAAIPLVGPTLRGTGRAVSKLGEKTVETVIPVSKREAGILQTYKANNPFFKRVADVLQGTEKAPTTAGKTATRTTAGQTLPGLFGTKSQIGVQAKRAKDSLWKDVIQPRLRASEQAVDLDGFFAKVEDDIIKSNPELSRQKALLEALNAVKEDYAGTKAVSLEGLQKLKEGWSKFVPDKAYQGKPIGGAFNDVRNQLADEARQTIYSQLGDDVKQAYFDYGNLQGLTEMGKVSMTGQKLKGGTGGLLSELLSQTITPIGTVGGQAVYRLGKGIEFVGNLGAKNLGEALGVNLKFPGDMAVDDISKTVKKAKSLPNKQGGFIKIGQDAKAPMTTQSSQTPNSAKNTVIPKSSPKSNIKSIAQKLDNTDKSIMLDFLEGKNKAKATDLARTMGLDSAFGTDAALKKDFTAILDAERALTKSKMGLKGKGVIPETNLINEAKKYKSAEDFIKAQQPEKIKFTSAKAGKDYMGGHEAPMAEDINAPIWDLTGKYTGNNLYPKDIYSPDASRLYSSGMDYDNQAISILKSIKDKPNAKVTVYRSVPKDVKGEINPGDWVTLTKEYAIDHGESNLGGKYKIVKKEVYARDIFTDANSIQEFGYDPQPRLAPKDTPYDLLSKAYKEGKVDLHSQYQSQLEEIWKKANSKANKK